MHNGQPVEVEHDRVPFELYQYGFGLVTPINVTFAQDGSYSHLLFNGDYKLVVRPGQGPFLWPQTGGKSDSLSIVMSGNKELDIEVTPYYMIRSPQISSANNKVSATFNLEKIITDANGKNIENVNLYINKTAFVSASDNIGRTEIAGVDLQSMNNISLSVDIPNITPTQNYVFARIGVKMVDVEDRIFSSVVKLEY